MINPAQVVEELKKEINQEELELQKFQEKQNQLLFQWLLFSKKIYCNIWYKF